MKTIYHILLMMAFCAPSILNAQHQSVEDQLMGNWVLDYQATLGAISGDSKEKYNQMDKTRKTNIKGFYKGRHFSFSQDGRYKMTHGNGTAQQGTWKFTNNKKKLELVDTSGVSIVCTLSFSGNQLIMALQGNKVNNALLKSWVFRSETQE